MRYMLRKLKDKLFYIVVEKNPYILTEYQEYKWMHEDGKENKLKSWGYLLNLNVKYRMLRIQNVSNYKNTKSSSSKKRVGKKKLPYLSGSESKIVRRNTPHYLAKQLLKYDVVSFDIFDTLILRPFSDPSYLFMILAEKHNLQNFMEVRIEAEKEAREMARIIKGNREVTIYDIYEIVQFKTGIDRDYGVKVEFETELEFCFANPYMKEIFLMVKAQNKKIIGMADTCLTSTMVSEILSKNGFEGFYEIYVSSESNGSKKDKNLYKLVKHQLDNHHNLVHIGDDYQADIVYAAEFGFETVYYKNVHMSGNKFRADEMSDLIGATYSGIVNAHLHNGIRKYSPYYEFGFIYGGIYVLGYCKWIYDYVKQNNIDRVVFLSRHGEIIQKVFNYLFDDVKNSCIYWSKLANSKYASEFNRDFLLRELSEIIKYDKSEKSIKQILESLGLESMSNLLIEHELNEEEIVHEGNLKLIEKFLVENWEVVLRELEKEKQAAKKYLINVIADSRKIAIADGSCQSTEVLGLKQLIAEKWELECEVHCLIAADSQNNINLMKKDLEAYLFSSLYNREHFEFHTKNNRGTNRYYFEIFSQSRTPVLLGFKESADGIEFNFDIPEIENFEIIEQVQEGIFDFVKSYVKTFGRYEYLLNISGYDAYLPFKLIAKNLKFIKKYFGDFRYFVVDDQTNGQSQKTLREIMKEAGL